MRLLRVDWEALDRTESRSLRIRQELNAAGEERCQLLVTGNIDDADARQLAAKERLDAPTRLGIENLERSVHNHPPWPLQYHARDCQTLLLVVVQLPIPSLG